MPAALISATIAVALVSFHFQAENVSAIILFASACLIPNHAHSSVNFVICSKIVIAKLFEAPRSVTMSATIQHKVFSFLSPAAGFFFSLDQFWLKIMTVLVLEV